VRQILLDIQGSTKAAVAVTDEGIRRVEAGVQLVTATGMMIHQIAQEVESGAQANVQMAAARQQTLVGTRQAEQTAQGLLSLAHSLQQSIAVYRL
jgi:methyl-accepting chemotaxis protein